MDAVRIETLPSTKSLLITKVPDTTDISKEKDDILFLDEVDEDDEIRLRLSDDDDAVEQDNTSGQNEKQQTNSHLKRNDQLRNKSNLPETEITNLVEEDRISNSDSVDKNIVNEICSVNEEESTMSGSEKAPPLMQSSPKYWSNNFDKRWKGANNPRGHQLSHRNANDWYHQQYPEKDKLNNKNHFNNHNNHYNKLHNNSLNCNEEMKKEEVSESPKLKNNVPVSKDADKNDLIQDNGISNDSKSKVNDSSVDNDKSFTEKNKLDSKEGSETEIDSDQKENKFVSDESKVSSDQKINVSNSDILKNSETKSSKELPDTKNIENTTSATKDCDQLRTELEELGDSKPETDDKVKESKCNLNSKTKVNDDADSLSTDKDLDESETPNKTPIKIAEEASQNNDILKENKCDSLMEVDGDSHVVDNVVDKSSSNNHQSGTSGVVKDNDIKKIENNVKNLSEDVQSEEKMEIEKSITEEEEVVDNQKSNNDADINESSNQSAENEKSIIVSEIEISDNELDSGKDSSVTTNSKENEIMEVETDGESSNSLSIAVAEIKGSDSNDSKPSIDDNNKSSSTTPLLTVTENKCDQDKSMAKVDEEIKDEGKQLEDLKDQKVEDNLNRSLASGKEKVNNIIEEVDLVDDEPEVELTFKSNETEVDTSRIKVDAAAQASTVKDTSQTVPISSTENNKVEESNEEGRAVVHKRRRRKRHSNLIYPENSAELQTENGVRQKRRSAKNAEEMIRKEILKGDEDSEDSSDESSRMVPVNYKKANVHAQPLSPPSLKRTLDDIDRISDSISLKKIKSMPDSSMAAKDKDIVLPSKESIAESNELVRKMSQEDIRGKLKKLKPEELEALLVQKILECITIRGEMGKLREQARVSKRNQEATRAKCQQLQKQVEGFDMVLKRITYDKNSNNDKYIAPIKINRSVGLQVNFLSQDHGIQSLKHIQVAKMASNGGGAATNAGTVKTIPTAPGNNGAVQDNRSMTQSPRKTLKTRSPRRIDPPTPTVISPVSSTGRATPTALVMSKSVDPSPKRTIALHNSNNIVQLMPNGPQQQAVVVNNTVGGAPSRPATLTIQRTTSTAASKTSDLIDLTDEEDKAKSTVITPITPTLSTRFPRVLQAVPASVALTNSTNLRLVQAGSQGAPTAIVNNINTPRLAYVMQSGVNGVPRQLVLTSNNTIRPVTSVTTRNISTISYKQGVPTLTNGTVRVLTAQAPTSNVQPAKHPAPLPETPLPESNPAWKSPPPAPSLKISKVATGIVLSWNMTLSDKFAEIVSYQLYAYQEVTGTSPNSALWKKVGDVRALPLPMACTLTQFTEGNNYYFAVRAVDVHSRFGQYSKPGNISL